MANNKKAGSRKPSKLSVQSEILRSLSAAMLDDVNGGAASWACDNQSVGFLCGNVCGGSRSCAN